MNNLVQAQVYKWRLQSSPVPLGGVSQSAQSHHCPPRHIVYLCKWEILYLCISKYCSYLNRVHLSCIALCALSDFQIYVEQKQQWSHLQKFPSTSAKSCHHLKWTFITMIMVHTSSATRNCDRKHVWFLNILDLTVFAYCATVELVLYILDPFPFPSSLVARWQQNANHYYQHHLQRQHCHQLHQQHHL